jgi:hypothetical protein
MNGDLLLGLAGRPFRIEPQMPLGDEEREVLERISGSVIGNGQPFVVTIRRAASAFAQHEDEAPAVIDVEGDRVVVRHRRFVADIDPIARRAAIERIEGADAMAIEITLRTALSCIMPLDGGVLLHSACVVAAERALVFFGVSGAGKSTLASLMPVPIISDELVGIVPHNGSFAACATGFWGTLDQPMDQRSAPDGAFPLQALTKLDRGEELSITPIPRAETLRCLLTVAVVPPHPALWNATLRVLQALAATTPVLRMAWTPDAENARRVLEHFSAGPFPPVSDRL